MKIDFKKNKGSMSIEVLVATLIITMAVLSATAVANKSVSVSRQSTRCNQAAFLLEEGAEAVRLIRDNNWNMLSSSSAGTTYYLLFTNGSWSLVTDRNNATPIQNFTRSIEFYYVNRDISTNDIVSIGDTVPMGAYLDNGTRFVKVNLSWLEGGTTKSKDLSFYITNLFQ